jgi:hypothetical protein
MKSAAFILMTFLSIGTVSAQIVNTATMDSSDYQIGGKVTLEGYVDTYFAYNFNEPKEGDQPYLVSMSRHNEININLAFVDVKYSSSRLRARVAPGFGTYVNANYINEKGSLKNLIEANCGIKLFKHKNIWLDVGILGSPYTNESAISKDHLTYTRSLAAENVPYYLSGAKISLPVSNKFNTYFYLINGWQQITDQNSNKSFGSQIEFRPNKYLLVNWNNYLGNESAAIDSVKGLRYFTDIYLIYSKERLSMSSCVYYGIQENLESVLRWWQANAIFRYAFTSVMSGSFRFEYFNDMNGALVLPITPANGFETIGLSLGINFKLEDNILFRTEARQFVSNKDIFKRNEEPASTSMTLTASLCAWF